MSQVERSLVLVKPDGYSRGLTGEVLRRIEAKGYKLVALKCLILSQTPSPGGYLTWKSSTISVLG